VLESDLKVVKSVGASREVVKAVTGRTNPLSQLCLMLCGHFLRIDNELMCMTVARIHSHLASKLYRRN